MPRLPQRPLTGPLLKRLADGGRVPLLRAVLARVGASRLGLRTLRAANIPPSVPPWTPARVAEAIRAEDAR